MTEPKMVSEPQMARDAADTLEQLARDLREGRCALQRFESDVGFDGPVPTGEVSYLVKVVAGEAPRSGAIVAKVEGITLGPVLGFEVEARGSNHVDLSVTCRATYDEVEALARLASERTRRLKARSTPISSGDVGGGPG